MSIPNYRVNLSYDAERKLFSARTPELEHCQGEGGTRAEAIARLEEEIRAQVENMHAHGSNPPAPVDEAALTGELRVKLSQTLHRELLWQSRQEGVEVEQLLAEIVSAGVEARRGHRAPKGNRAASADAPHDNIGNAIGGNGGNNRGNRGYGNRYNPAVLDDRANFIEYVRNLDQGQPAGGGGGYAGGRGPGRGPQGGGGGAGGGGRRRGPGPGGGGGGGRGPGGGGPQGGGRP